MDWIYPMTMIIAAAAWLLGFWFGSNTCDESRDPAAQRAKEHLKRASELLDGQKDIIERIRVDLYYLGQERGKQRGEE